MGEFARRLLFAVIAAPVVLGILLWGGAPLAALLAVASAIGAWEFFRLARGAGNQPLDDIGIALAGLTPLAVHARYLGYYAVRPVDVLVIVLVVCALALWMRGSNGQPMASLAITFFGALYTGATLSFAYALRYHQYAMGGRDVTIGNTHLVVAAGGALVVLPVVATWATDIGAYAVGRAFGRRKLMPSVSPAKTVAGAVGGVVVSVLVTWVYARAALRPVAQLGLTPTGIVVFGTVISVAAQVGDLFESLLKREAGVKDSSQLIPGHGGLLDRVDSLIFVLPVAYLLLGLLLVPAPV
ncbi:MAG TPA: phosphatidate cytidylyltransferase [Gemmatimonadaceae bacterium]|nr:phosphatidate cytidylyltransferase [Gemmatimonadaceae bacterium]